MYLIPNKITYQKIHKTKKPVFLKQLSKCYKKKDNIMCYLTSSGFSLTNSQNLETVRRYLVRLVGRQGKVFCLASLSQPLTKKASQSRMGKGYGKFYNWRGYINPGQKLFGVQVRGLDHFKLLSKSLRFLNKKLKVKFYLCFIKPSTSLLKLSSKFIFDLRFKHVKVFFGKRYLSDNKKFRIKSRI